MQANANKRQRTENEAGGGSSLPDEFDELDRIEKSAGKQFSYGLNSNPK